MKMYIYLFGAAFTWGRLVGVASEAEDKKGKELWLLFGAALWPAVLGLIAGMAIRRAN